MRRSLSKDELEAGQFYLMISHNDKTAEVILVDRLHRSVYYRTGIAQDFDTENLTTEVFWKIPTPEGYTPQ